MARLGGKNAACASPSSIAAATTIRAALLGPQLIRLRPADHTRVRIESYQLLVEPEHRLHWLRDPHGNRVARVTFKAAQAVSELDVQVELSVEINAINPIDFFIDDRARKVPFVYPDGQGRHHAI